MLLSDRSNLSPDGPFIGSRCPPARPPSSNRRPAAARSRSATRHMRVIYKLIYWTTTIGSRVIRIYGCPGREKNKNAGSGRRTSRRPRPSSAWVGGIQKFMFPDGWIPVYVMAVYPPSLSYLVVTARMPRSIMESSNDAMTYWALLSK